MVVYQAVSLHRTGSCACDNVFPYHIGTGVSLKEQDADLERRIAMEPCWRSEPAAVVRRFSRPLYVQHLEFHARSNPRSR